MAATNPSSPQRSSTLFWILICAVVLFLLGGCTVVIMGATFWLRNVRNVEQPTARPVAAPVAAVKRAPPPAPVAIATPPDGVDYETAVLMNIYAQVNPSVVNISIFQKNDSFHSDPISGFDSGDLIETGGGSGFVWDATGHLVTNFHVVADAAEVHVRFYDGTESIGEVVGSDASSDLAVVKIDPTGYDLRPVRRGDIDNVKVGMRVAAIGNPFGLEGTLTSGIVSAVGRSIPSLNSFNIPDSIQTDAPINPGNSGGPLLNEQGEVIGINAQIRSEERANSGVGFAIPIVIVERVVPALIDNGSYDHSYMGISARTFSPLCADELGLDASLRGALVIDALPGTPASRAGVQGGTAINSSYPTVCPDAKGGDLITAINGQPVIGFDDVLIYLARYTSPGDTITLTMLRDQEFVDVSLELTKRPRRE